jgi:tRNA A-37 threonylcarbamoyl transferase component Bud32
MRNAKYAPRSASGKFITIYPRDEAACERILAELDSLIGGAPGPYILSDLRYADGPLYVRYGGFAKRYCRDAADLLVPALADGTGRLVPDLRTPVFTVPAWVTLPGFLAPHLAARDAVTMKDLPYQIGTALHFSNGGGVYLATDRRTGERVVLKEARPHAGLAADRTDAVTRLGRECDIMRHLSGLGVAPEVRDYFVIGDHHFLVEDYIDGVALNTYHAQQHPMLRATPDPQEIAGYTSWALRFCDRLELAVQAIHERGIVFNDLHTFNVMIRPDDSVALIDFEAAARIGENKRPVVGNPGFMAPRDRTGFGIDRYSLACLKLATFMPLTKLFRLDPGKAEHLAEVISAHFPVPAGFLDAAVSEITGQPRHQSVARSGPVTEITPGPAGWEPARRSLARAILASATPARRDRLFPGDIEQFENPAGGLCIAYGAAGVLHALSGAGVDIRAEHAEWLIARTAEPVTGGKLGLYDGMTGVACVLDRLGHRGPALRLAEMCLAEQWETLGADLYGGLSGIALALLYLGDATGEPRLHEAALRAVDIVTGRVPLLTSGAASASRKPGQVGLLLGLAGPALLFIRMFERTADSRYLDLAAAALAMDLDRCVVNSRGVLHVQGATRTLPYLEGGSVGIGLVIEDYLSHRGLARFEEAARDIQAAACSAFYAQPGLFRGRAGMMLYLARAARRRLAGETACPAESDPHVAAHVRRLTWHAVSYGGGMAFPGETLYRLSMDLATGTAGVLTALAAALSPAGAGLPFHGGHQEFPGCALQGPEKQPITARR